MAKPLPGLDVPVINLQTGTMAQTWYDYFQSLSISSATSSPTRTILTASRTYYIRTDGSDSNDGLADSPSRAFATFQHADDVASQLDWNGQQVTYQHGVETGVKTFTAPCTINQKTGGGSLQVKGSPTIGNTVFNVVTDDCFKCFDVGLSVNFDQMTLKGGVLGEISVFYKSIAGIGSAVYFDAATFAHVYVHDHIAIALLLGSSYKIIGGGGYHIFINAGMVFHESCVLTITGTPAFSGAFVQAINGGVMQLINFFAGGGATGTRYFVASNAVIDTFGQGINILPGNIAGVPAPPANNTGGQYIP